MLKLKPSRALLVATVIIHVMALVAIAIAAITLWIKLIIAAAVLLSLAFNIRDTLQTPQLIWRAENNWFIDDQPNDANSTQQSLSAQLSAINFASRWLVILTLTTETQHKRKFIIPFDALDKDTFRWLRVRLRIDGYRLLNPQDINQDFN